MSDKALTLFPDKSVSNVESKKYLHKKVTFKAHGSGQKELFPEDIEASIPKFHIARFINVAIGKVNIDSIISKYVGGGTSAYHPRLLLKVWLLAFTYKSYSCRGVAKLLRENIAFKWISDNTEVDFRTLNNFRLRLEGEIKDIFRQILQVALKKGMIEGKDIFVDHTKFEANANRHKVIWGKRVKNQINKIEEELSVLFSYVSRIEKSENKRYGDSDYPETQSRNFTDSDIEEMISEVNVGLKEKRIDRDQARERKKRFRRLKILLHRLKRYNYPMLLFDCQSLPLNFFIL